MSAVLTNLRRGWLRGVWVALETEATLSVVAAVVLETELGSALVASDCLQEITKLARSTAVAKGMGLFIINHFKVIVDIIVYNVFIKSNLLSITKKIYRLKFALLSTTKNRAKNSRT
jgi:hypothetical protein